MAVELLAPHAINWKLTCESCAITYMCTIVCFMWHDIVSLLVFWWSCIRNCHRALEDKAAWSYKDCCRKRSNSDPSYGLWEIYYIRNIAGSTLITLFATTAFSMGINCPDIKMSFIVVHLSPLNSTSKKLDKRQTWSTNSFFVA